MARNQPSLRIVDATGERIVMGKSGQVKRTFPVLGSDDRVVLLHWGASQEDRLQNVARIDRHGSVIWRAALPGSAPRDCFVTLTADGSGYLAETYSGVRASIDAQGRSAAG